MALKTNSKLARAMVLTAAFTAAAACTPSHDADTAPKVEGPKTSEHQGDNLINSWKAKPSDYVSPGPRG